VASEANGTLDQAQSLTADLNSAGQVGVTGTIGVAGPAQVDWFSFTLTRAASVGMTTLDRLGGSSFQSVLSLYATDLNDPYTPVGYRLLAQDDGGTGTGDALLQRQLNAGTYYVAVSGSGDRAFNPFLTNSGFSGSIGAYGLLITATDLHSIPAVLSVDPAPGATLTSSPFLVRVDLGLAPTPTETVQVTDANNQVVPNLGVNYLPDSNQLQWLPAAPLPIGLYTVSVTDGGQTLYTRAFQVTGIEGNTAPGAGADDAVPSPTSPTTPHELGDITGAGLLQFNGAIGDDPTDPIPFDPSDVDLYHFEISGSGFYAVSLDLFTERIGSTLQGGLSLFAVSPTTGQLTLLDSYDEGQANAQIRLTNGQPIFSDPVLFDGLTAGDYYVAVSGSFNVPDPPYLLAPNLPGSNGVFDPTVSHSGTNGFTTGPYVLGILAQAETAPPHVTASSPSEGAVLTQPPTELVVGFDKPMNFARLSYEAYRDNFTLEINAVSLIDSNGQSYSPYLIGYDYATNTATFQMTDALPNGTYELHVSGASGLTDVAGTPLVGNDPSGDYVVHFTVNAAPRGTNGNPQLWTAEPVGSPQPQDLGALFPDELTTNGGVTIVRNPVPATTGYTSDEFQLQLPNPSNYTFTLTGPGLPPGATFTLMDGSGNALPVPPGFNNTLLASLDAGTYFIRVSWPAAGTTSIGYALHITGLFSENAVPLTSGPTPALQIRLATIPGSGSTVTSPGPIVFGVSGTTPAGPIALGPVGPIFNASVAGLPIPGLSTGTITVTTPIAGPASFDSLATLAALPPDLNRVLSSGPLGNPSDLDLNLTTTRTDRLLVQLPDVTVVQSVLQLTVLTQPAGSSENFAASSSSAADFTGPTNPLAPFAATLGRMSRAWGEVLDRLFTTRTESDVQPAPEEGSDLLEESSALDEADLSERLALLGRRPSTDVARFLANSDTEPSAIDRAWAGVLASLVVCPLALTLGQGSPSPEREPDLVNREERN
jgi:hypothetical protein